MSDKKSGPKKAASLTSALLARKGMATPAGFVRVATDASQAPAQVEDGPGAARPGTAQLIAMSGQNTVDSGQTSLDLGETAVAAVHDRSAANDGEAAESDWASLSDIDIGPRFRAVEAPAARRGTGDAGDTGRADVGPAGPPIAASGRPTPGPRRVEPTFVAARDAADGVHGPPAPPDRRPAAGLKAPAAPAGAPADVAPVTGRAVGDDAGAPVSAPPRRREAGEGARQDRRPRGPAIAVGRRAPRRRRRVLPAVVSLLALLVFLFVSWAVYQVGQGDSAADGDGGGAIWSSAEELRFAITQLVAGVTGRIDETPERSATVAGGDTADVDEVGALEAPEESVAATSITESTVVEPPGTAPAGIGAPSGAEPLVADTGASGVDDVDGGVPLVTDLVAAAPSATDGAETTAETTPTAVPVLGTAQPTGAEPAGDDATQATIEIVVPPPPPLPPIPPVSADPVLADTGSAASAPRLAAPAGGTDGDGDVASAAVAETVVTAPPGPTLLSPTEVAQSLPSAADLAPPPDVEAPVSVASGPDTDAVAAGGDDQIAGPAVPELSTQPVAAASPAVDDSSAPAAESPVAAAGDGALAALVGPGSGPTGAGAAPASGVPIPKPAVLARGSTPPPGPAAAAPQDGFAVQLSSLKDEASARREQARLSAELADVLDDTKLTVEQGTAGNRGTFYRVLTTRFAVRAEAQAICRAIQGTGQDCLVVQQR